MHVSGLPVMVVWSCHVSLICDRCFNSVKFMESFKFDSHSIYDFCGNCFKAVTINHDELMHFRGSDTRSCDINEFVRACNMARAIFDKVKLGVVNAQMADALMGVGSMGRGDEDDGGIGEESSDSVDGVK